MVRFEIWKAIFRIVIQSTNFESWETIINDSFIPTYQIDGEVVDKPDSLLVNRLVEKLFRYGLIG